MLKNFTNFVTKCEDINVDCYRIISVDDWLEGKDRVAPTLKALTDWIQFYMYYVVSTDNKTKLETVTEMLVKRI